MAIGPALRTPGTQPECRAENLHQGGHGNWEGPNRAPKGLSQRRLTEACMTRSND
jgi:hypothetical protein